MANAWRSASMTLDTAWGHLYRRLKHAADFLTGAVDHIPVQGLIRNEWCAPCWKMKHSTVQFYEALCSGEPCQRPPLSSSQFRSAQCHGRRAVREAVEAGRKPKMQSAYLKSISHQTFPDKLHLLIGRRVRSWFNTTPHTSSGAVGSGSGNPAPCSCFCPVALLEDGRWGVDDNGPHARNRGALELCIWLSPPSRQHRPLLAMPSTHSHRVSSSCGGASVSPHPSRARPASSLPSV